MSISVSISIRKLKKLWDKLYAESDLSFFQSYEWNAALYKSFYLQKLVHYKSYKGKKLRFCTVDNKVIVPLVIDSKERLIVFLGEDKPSDYMSFIYGEIDPQELRKAAECIIHKYPGYRIQFNRIPEGTVMQRVLDAMQKESEYSVHSHTITNQGITIDAGREETYLSTLKKSVRQNYRTSLNRMKRDEKEYEIRTVYDTLTREKTQLLYQLYVERRRGDSDPSARPVYKRCADYIRNTFLSNDPISFYARKAPVFLSLIMIDGEVASFCEGGANAAGSILEISRVATNKDYYHYSPGMVLLIETIEQLHADKKYTLFDLTRGDEDYKIKLGSHGHYSYSYAIDN